MTWTPMVVAETEFRRTARAIAGDSTKLVMLASVAVFTLGPMTLLGLFFLPRMGAEAAAGPIPTDVAETVTAAVTGGTALVWVFLVFMTLMRTVTTVADIDEPDFLLVSTSVRNAVVGVVAAEILSFGLFLIPLTTVFAAAFAYGAGTVLPVVIVPVTVALVLATAIPVGFVVGVWVRHLLTVYEPIARFRTLLFAAFWIVYFGAIITGGFDAAMETLYTRLQSSPLGWPGHLLLLGVPGIDPLPAGIVGGVVGSVLVFGAAFAIAVPSARHHWFADPARVDDEEHDPEEEAASDRLGGLLSGTVSRPVRTMTVTAIRRTKRAPIRLAYVGYPILGTLWFGKEIVETGTVPSALAVLICLYVVWAAGATFTLNPLGDFGPALPAVVTSSITGRQAVRGRILAGALVGVPLAIVVSLAVGVLSPLSLERTGLLVVGTTVGAVATPALATGIGSAFPRFGSVSVTNNREAVMPSKTAFLVYTLAIAFPAAAAVVVSLDAPELIAGAVAAASAWALGAEVAVSPDAIAIVAWTVLVLGLLAPPVSYRYAVERFDWYTLD
ncbi:hypothetical protein [Halopiger djelfimassiliensis]|uniref:hypothetical protein n=1 Tax=Halopiger djelfimassiliensis TaxID=1293047 RepID=UPI000677E688|nr:hypothetical protein [Halopiger djelfimassiliensis]